MPRWLWIAALAPTLAVLAWWYAASRATAPGEAPIAAISARDPGSLSGASVADRARDQAQRDLVKLVTTLADGQRRLTDGLQTLREDLQAVRGEVRELQGAAARRADTAPSVRRKPRKARPQPVSAVQPAWRWVW